MKYLIITLLPLLGFLKAYATSGEQLNPFSGNSEPMTIVRETDITTGQVVESFHVGKSLDFESILPISNGLRIDAWSYQRGREPKLLRSESIFDKEGKGRIILRSTSAVGNDMTRHGDSIRVSLIFNQGSYLLTSWGEDTLGGLIENYGVWSFDGGHRVFDVPAENLEGRDCFAVFQIKEGFDPILIALESINILPIPSVSVNFQEGEELELSDVLIFDGIGLSDEDTLDILVYQGGAERLIKKGVKGREWHEWVDVVELGSVPNEAAEIRFYRVYRSLTGELNRELIFKRAFRIIAGNEGNCIKD